MYSDYNVYFSDPNNDTEALNLEVRGNCTFLVQGFCSHNSMVTK